ncbi:hypothetical protein H257_17392 [Aphanomyces astaci]|uniref:Uncharacterized protein n=1 Tax=Aphanomyces astaci TaxID=112090 RepID=W4FH53_APHAT|nr:hypothetical protein H257_17392 [Aphanomyces astaci]ETV66063.1 hypothetical protein H257_17392 [Aphanomyces astaci]|eukprot:XP_009844492.1 hypothetical protein H257_17392 [Aphanomyces astaci]
MSDKFGSYVSTNEVHTLANNRDLQDMRYGHQWVNYTDNFVDPTIGATPNASKVYGKNQVKRHIKTMRGMVSDLLPPFMDECLWRSWYFPPGASGTTYFKGLVVGVKKK